MKHLVRLSVFLFILCTGFTFAMGQAAVKQLPDEAKQAQLQSNADEVLAAKLDLYSQKMGFSSLVPNFTPTGNPEVDSPAYFQAKKDWIATNPPEYLDALSSPTIRPGDAVRTDAQPTARPE